MDIPDRNGRRLGWSSRIVRGGNRGRLQETLEAGRPEHEQIVILAISRIAQLVGDAARRDERIASPENEDLAADNNLELSREDIVSLVLSRTPGGFQPDAGAAADNDDGLAEQFRFAVGCYSTG